MNSRNPVKTTDQEAGPVSSPSLAQEQGLQNGFTVPQREARVSGLAHPPPGSGHPNGVQLGGIGTGRIELGSNGRISLAGITNNWQRLLAGLEGTFFCLQVSHSGRPGGFCVLQSDALEGHPGAGVTYRGRHPAAEVHYSPAGCGIEVGLLAFSPLVPHDFEASNIPGAVFRFRISNPGETRITARLGFSWENLLGVGGGGRRGMALESDRTGNLQRLWKCGTAAGIHFFCSAGSRHPNTCGDMVLAVAPQRDTRIWTYMNWNVLGDRHSVLAALAAGDESPGRFDGGDLSAQEERARRRDAEPPSWDDPDPRFGGGRTGLEGAVHPAAVLGVTVDIPAVPVPAAGLLLGSILFVPLLRRKRRS